MFCVHGVLDYRLIYFLEEMLTTIGSVVAESRSVVAETGQYMLCSTLYVHLDYRLIYFLEEMLTTIGMFIVCLIIV